MHSIASLLSKIRNDFPDLTFEEGSSFRWAPTRRTITYQVNGQAAASHLLHEVAHAALTHDSYSRDVGLIGLERDAWTYATKTLAPRYGVTIDPDTVQIALDTYRDWLHARSTCPYCDAVGIQTKRHSYHCLACLKDWKVNDARICGLRRYKQNTST